MSYAIAGNSVCQLTLRSTLFGQEVMNTFHFRLDLAGGALPDGAAFLSDFNDMLAVADTFYDTYMLTLPVQCQNIYADLQWIDPDRLMMRSFVVGPQGATVHVPTTANLASALELRGDIADKRSIGTKHIPGLGGVAVAAGIVQAALIAELANFGIQATLPVGIGGRTMTPIIFGRARAQYTDKHGVVHPPIGKSYRPITAFRVQTTARVMRRRTVGVGI